MPATNEYLDILIITPLTEESFILDKEFEVDTKFLKKESESIIARHTVKHVVMKSAGSRDIRIGLTSIKTMGNIWAFRDSNALIRGLSPRFVILMGLGGGRMGLVSLGDAVISNHIHFSSFGKLADKSCAEVIKDHFIKVGNKEDKTDKIVNIALECGVDLKEIGYVDLDSRATADVSMNQRLLEIVDQPLKEATWVNDAETLFNTHIKKFEKNYYQDSRQTHISFSELKATRGTIASGDWIIASDQFKKQFDIKHVNEDPQTKENKSVFMYEMESYGTALCCEGLNIPFLMVKGVSDFAGGDKLAKNQKDNFRLAAICSASAFTLNFIKNKHLLNYLDELHPALGWSQKACLWPEKNPQQCSLAKDTGEGDLLEKNRKCMQLKAVPESREIYASRVFEGAQAREYSLYLKHLMSRPKTSQVILIFPYKITGFVKFLKNHTEFGELKKQAQNLDKLLKKKVTESQNQEIANLAIRMGRVSHSYFSHFEYADQVCADMIAEGRSFPQIANQICRVVLMNKDDQKKSWTNRAILLNLATLGLCVPTLLIDEKYIAKEYFADEATYVQTSVEPEISSTLCLKYIDKSKLLIVLGRCNAENEIDGECSKSFQFVTELRLLFKGDKQGNLSLREPYKIFPSLSLLEQFNIDYKEFIPNNNLLKEKLQNKVAKEYFDTLRQLECPISKANLLL